jgi:dipeptidyl aminopeptidase/acylaminoacyl peptidase
MRAAERLGRSARNPLLTLQRSAIALFAAAMVMPAASGALGTGRPLTIDDLLKLSDVGRAIVRPGTDSFVLEHSPPYDTLTDYGAGSTGTWQGSDYEILTVGPDAVAPKLLFKPAEGTTYRLGSFSQDGRFLTMLAMRDGRVKLAAYDFQVHRLREFALAPRFPPTQADPDWTWLDTHRLAVAAHPPGEGPWPLTFRRAIGNRLSDGWLKSWKGKEPSVDQYDSSSSDVVRLLPGRLVIVDLASGKIERLADGQFSGLHASPNGRWLAAVRQSLLPQATLEHPHLDWTDAQSTLTLFDLTGRRSPRTLAANLDVLSTSIEWNLSSEAFAFFASKSRDALRDGRFWVVSPTDCSIKAVSHDGLSLASQRARGGPQWPERAAWIGDSLTVFARSTPNLPGTFEFEDIKSNDIVDPRVGVAGKPTHWFLLSPNSAAHDLTPEMQSVSPYPIATEKSSLVVLADGHAWRLRLLAPPTLLFPEFTPRLSPLSHRDFFALARSNGAGGIVSISGNRGTLAQITADEKSPVIRILDTPQESDVLALSASGAALLKIGAGKSARLALMKSGAAPIALGELNPVLDDITETRWVDFEYANSAGSPRERLSGCLLLPPDYHAGAKYPLIVEVYPDRPGGCGSTDARRRYAMAAHPTSYSEHLLAARGFVVFRPDTGAGISRTENGPQAQLSTIVDRGLDAVLDAGYADRTRIGLLGFSQGGFASLWIATQSRRYGAVVSLNGWSDLFTSFFDMNWTQELAPLEMPDRGDLGRYLSAAGSDFNMGGTPWQFPQRYIENSPLWRSDSVTAPVLLIHSDMDTFGDESYKEFFSSLYIQKKDARLLIYRGEGHSPSSPANIRHMWNNIFSWYDRYLRIERDAHGKIILPD